MKNIWRFLKFPFELEMGLKCAACEAKLDKANIRIKQLETFSAELKHQFDLATQQSRNILKEFEEYKTNGSLEAWKNLADQRQIIISKMNSVLIHNGINFDFQKALFEEQFHSRGRCE